MYNERVIHVQKIKVKKIIFRYISHSCKKLIINFYKLYTFRKASYSGCNTLKYAKVSWISILNNHFITATAYHALSPVSILKRI